MRLTHLSRLPVTLQGLDDAHGGQPLMDEERKRGHVEGQPLGLAGPVEEGLPQRGELVHRILEPAHYGPARSVVEEELPR